MAIPLRTVLSTPSDLGATATTELSGALNLILADVFALYLKTKNFHWHMSGAHFRDFHLMLDEQSNQIYAMVDVIAERVRKLGGRTIHSIGEINRTKRILDNDAEFVAPQDMLSELASDNQQLTRSMREVHDLCDKYRDIATASLIENWIDESEGRTWFLYESTRKLGTEG